MGHKKEVKTVNEKGKRTRQIRGIGPFRNIRGRGREPNKKTRKRVQMKVKTVNAMLMGKTREAGGRWSEEGRSGTEK